MRARSFLAAAWIVLSATPALSAGINLRWTNCSGDGGVFNRNFACASNVGTNVLVGSFVLDADFAQMSGAYIYLDVATASASLPAWWQFKNAGSCRQTSLAFNTIANGADVVCADWASGQASGGVASYTVGVSGANSARVTAVVAVPLSGLADLVAGQEYFLANITYNNQKTVGTGACAGCTTPACAFLGTIQLLQQGGGSLTITTPAVGNYVTWQGGAGVPLLAGGGCAPLDTAGFAIGTSVVGRGSVIRSRYKPEYPPGSPITLSAAPLPGDRFLTWSGDTTTTQPTLDIVVTHPLSYTANFEKDPAAAPQLAWVADYPGDQGGLVLAHWDRSPLDGVIASGFLSYYAIQRRAITPPGAAWSNVAIYNAVSVPSYEYGATTTADSTLLDPALYHYRIAALAAGDTLTWISNEIDGYSVDNLAPPAPGSVSGSIGSGAATMFWPAVEVEDLDHYAIYRGLESPPIDAAHRVGTTTLTGFNDLPGYFARYRVTAVDIHGNEGLPTTFVATNTTGVDPRPVPTALMVGNPTPSPMANQMTLSIGLPAAMRVTADVLDAQGRLLRRLTEGERPSGWFELRWDARDAGGRACAVGMYFVRVVTPRGERLKRLALIQ